MIAKAVSGRVPKKTAEANAPFSSVLATNNVGYDDHNIPTDDSYICINAIGAELGKDVNNNGAFINSIPRRDSKGNLFTGTPIDEQDCANKKYVDAAVASSGGGGGSITVDQTYNAESKNAQSGKAVAEAINNKAPRVAAGWAEYPRALAVKSMPRLENIDGILYPKNSEYKHLNIDDGYSKDHPTIPDVSIAKGFIATRDKTTGNLWTGTPIDDEDCISKKTLETQLENHQQKLISGSNIKTINGTSILGSGDINISGSELLNKENIDYIIEQGTKEVDGVTWTYEKWNSGTFKMWGTVTATYIDPYLLTKQSINFPVELVENAIGFATVNEFLPSSSNSTKTPTILCKTNRCSVQVHDHFGTFTQDTTLNVAVQVIGKWRSIHHPTEK